MADFDGGFAVEPFMAQPAAASQVEPDITYERDIAPGARQLFDDIGAAKHMTWREKATMQQGLLQGVGDLAMQREKLEGVRMQKEMNRMRMERERFALDDVRNRRAQVQANQERMGGIGQELQSVLDLPIEEREDALNNIVARNFDVLSNSPTAGARIEAIRRTTRSASQTEQSFPPMFKSEADYAQYIADVTASTGGDPAAIATAVGAAWQGSATDVGVVMGGTRLAETERRTAEDQAKTAYTKRAEVIRDFAPKIDTFVLDFEETEEMQRSRENQRDANNQIPSYSPKYMSEATHIRAKRAVDQLGSDEDKRAWDEADGSPDRDRIRVQITRNAILRAENELLRRESNNPQSVGAGLVDVPGR
jgi:hypothetical protein